MRDGLALKIQIGDASFRGRLPLLPLRFKLWEAYSAAIDATRVLRSLEPSEVLELEESFEKDEGFETFEAFVEARADLELVDGLVHRKDHDFDLLDSDDIAAICLACIGFCWADEPLEVETWTIKRGRPVLSQYLLPGQASQLFRTLDRDVVSFGECMTDALAARGLTDPRALFRAGRDLREAVVDSIPKAVEVEDAAGN